MNLYNIVFTLLADKVATNSVNIVETNVLYASIHFLKAEVVVDCSSKLPCIAGLSLLGRREKKLGCPTSFAPVGQPRAGPLHPKRPVSTSPRPGTQSSDP